MAQDFRSTEVGERYAQALFDLANDNKRLDAVRADLRSLKAAWIDSADLRRLAGSPVIPAADKQKGLEAIADKAKFDPTTKKFLGLMAANGRAADLTGAVAAFETLYARHTGVVAAEVVSAKPLAAKQAAAVKAALKAALGREPELSARVDPGLLGGLKVKVGSRLFDASLKTKLDEMKFALRRA